MTEGQASRTAEYMALFRGLESARTHRLFDDPFAAAFLPSSLRAVARLARMPFAGTLIEAYVDRRWPGVRTSAVARTRFIDEALDAALAAGIGQVVILGAGFDARAYRIPAMARATIFEVDHPSTSARKRRVVDAACGGLPQHVRFVPIDFDTAALATTMEAAGFDRAQRTMVIWEGVTNYLTEGAVDATLRWCASTAVGSTVLFTYVHRRVLDAPAAFVGTERLFATLRAAGEEWTFGLDPEELADFVAARGLVLETDVGATEYRARAYGPAAARMQGYEFYRIAVCRVPG
jgi:methyltransferase (TIGR00027 family)